MTPLDLDRLGDAPKVRIRGSERTVPPAVTVDRVKKLLPSLGITRVATVTGLDKIGIPVVMVCRPNSRSVSVFQGKGADLDGARASGLMEAIETYHAETMLAPLVFASFEELRGRHRALDGRALPQSVAGYFHPQRRMLWVEGHDLIQQHPIWVPYEVVHTDFTRLAPTSGGRFRVSTNGLASGNHVLEAISHGLCEVVERDATTLWNFLDDRAKQNTEIDLASVDDELCAELIARCTDAGLILRVWEATSDIGIAVYVAELREGVSRRGAAWGQPAFGTGCHPSRQVGLMRAITESAQARTTFIAGARDDMSWEDYELEDSPPLALRHGLAGEPEYRRFSQSSSWSSATVKGDLTWAIDRLVSSGLDQIIVVDLTKPEFELPVVRVIVPHLEGPDEHFEDYVPGPRAQAVGAVANAVKEP